jgi:hypothetical protein
MECKNCNEALKPGWKVCPSCATRIENIITCSYCGEELQSRWIRCPICESPINKTSDDYSEQIIANSGKTFIKDKHKNNKALVKDIYTGSYFSVQLDNDMVVVKNNSGEPIAIRISWDGKDPHGMGAGGDSFINNYVTSQQKVSISCKGYSSVQIWAWGSSGSLVDSFSTEID